MRKLRYCVVMLAGLIAVLPAFAGDGGPARPFLIDIKVVAVPAGGAEDFSVTAGQAEKNTSTAGDGQAPIFFSDVSEVKMGDLTLMIDGGGSLLWDGAAEPPEDAGVEVIMTPRLMAQAGQEATVMSGSALQYFEKQDDGSFQLRVTAPDQTPELRIDLVVLPAGGETAPPSAVDSAPSVVQLDYSMHLVVMTGRETIPGVGLDVGRPILKTWQVATRLLVGLDQWHLVSGQLVTDPVEDGGDILLALLRVQQG